MKVSTLLRILSTVPPDADVVVAAGELVVAPEQSSISKAGHGAGYTVVLAPSKAEALAAEQKLLADVELWEKATGRVTPATAARRQKEAEEKLSRLDFPRRKNRKESSA